MFKKLVLFFLLFTLVYRPEFIFIPHSVNMFFGILGMLVYFSNRKRANVITASAGLSIGYIIRCFIPLVLVSFVSILVNFSFDLYYPRLAFSIVLSFFSYYLVAVMFYKIYGKMTIQKLSDYFIIAECLFLFIGLVSFFSPEVFNMLNSIQRLGEIGEDAIERTGGTRLISIGATFFTAAIINGFVLIIIGLHFLYDKLSVKKRIVYLISFLYIFAVGLMMGRTTLIGGALGVLLIAFSVVKGKVSFFKFFFSCAVTVGISIFIISKVMSNSKYDFTVLSEFGFEMFINYLNGEGFDANSNNVLRDMYNTKPTDIKTWIIGDAKWSEGDHYYKNVDSGYLRGLWYFGIIGLLTLFIYYYRIIRYCVVRQKKFFGKTVIPLLTFMGYVVILNYKGPADLYFYLLPYMYCTMCSDKKLITESITTVHKYSEQ